MMFLRVQEGRTCAWDKTSVRRHVTVERNVCGGVACGTRIIKGEGVWFEERVSVCACCVRAKGVQHGDGVWTEKLMALCGREDSSVVTESACGRASAVKARE